MPRRQTVVVKKSSSTGAWAGCLGIGLVLCVAGCGGAWWWISGVVNSPEMQETYAQIQEQADLDRAAFEAERQEWLDTNCTTELREDRRRLMVTLAEQGLRTEGSGSLPKLWVDEEFRHADLRQQVTIVEAVYAFWLCETDAALMRDNMTYGPLILKIDNGSLTGQRVGRYDPIGGLRWD